MGDAADKRAFERLKADVRAYAEAIPNAAGMISILVLIDGTGDPVYLLAGAPGPDPRLKWSPRHAEDALCEAIAWNRSMEEEIKREARAKNADKAPTVEGTKALN